MAGVIVSIGLLGAVAGSEATWSALVGTPAAGAAEPDSEGGTAAPSRVHVAQPGDTLWSIAARHRGPVDHSAFVDALVRLNGASIQVGQAVVLPPG